jgi:hypothetical protein
MRKSAIIILMLLAGLVTVVTGCGGAVHYDSRLSVADSLMQSDPDSALAIVEGLPLSELSTAGDSAYHDLLLTQARYRCYVIATSDSAINRALAYYRLHNGEQEKLTRAYIYKGAVMEELGHPDSAMIYYKHAETTAAPDDYFNLGYANLRIAELYQSLYTNDSVAIARMKRATGYFTIINDTSYLITTLGAQGALIADSAKYYLEKAIALAKATNSTQRFEYESKLAGYYFYRQDYSTAKDLAMDIIRNGADECDEDQFYYYAARSFIKLSRLDSARYVHSMIPAPIFPLDSMNLYRLEAELAEAEHRYQDHAAYFAKSKEINDRIFTNSLKSNIGSVEVMYDAEKANTQYRKNVFGKILGVAAVVILAMLLASWWLTKRIKKRISEYQEDINLSRAELEKTISLYEDRLAQSESSLARQQELLAEKDNKIQKVTKEKDRLLSQQAIVEGQVSKIVRKRLAAINELYQEIRVKTPNNTPYKRSLPLVSIIKDLNDKKKLSIITPKDSFWKKLKASIDDEYQGLATFVEKKYPFLTEKELKLFWLLSAKISPQIIKLCMDFTHYTTVSNYKRKLIKDIMGHDMKFEEFIQAYLDGKLN